MLPSPSSTFSPVYIATYAELATVLADSALVLWILSCFVSTLVVLLTFAHGPSIRGMKRSRQVLAVAVFLANACGLGTRLRHALQQPLAVLGASVVAATVTFASLPLALYEALGVPPLLLYFVATQSGVCLLCIFAYAAFYGAIAVMFLIPALPLVLFSVSACIPAGWVMAYWRIVQLLRQGEKRCSLERAVRLRQLAEAASASFAAHQRLSALLPGPTVSSTFLQQMRRVWEDITQLAPDQLVAWTAWRLTVTRAYPLADRRRNTRRYLPSAAQALRIPLLHEHLRRKSYPDTALDLTLLFLHRLSGFFIQTFLPFPSLRSLYHPVNSHLLLAVLFTPLFAYDTHPDDWPSSAGRDDPGITRSLRTLLNVAVRCIASLVDGVGTATPLSEVDAAAYVERVLDEAAAGRYAAEAEKRAHEAILDAVLGWAAVREGR